MAATNVKYGDPDIAYPNEILRTVVGSGVHGIAVEGTDDHDEMGIFVEPPAIVLGLGPPQDHYIWRTQPEGARSGPGDTDRTIYSLRKYLRLAVKGNPTALLPLFAPSPDVLISTPLGEELRSMRTKFLSREAVRRFLGYMRAQHDRMMGSGRRSSVPNRPELIEQFGWDVKYGSHALRLALQGYEIAAYGSLTLPLPTTQRAFILEIKAGKHSREYISELITANAAGVEDLLDRGRCPLPYGPDRDAISEWSVQAHRHWWQW